MNDEPIAWSSFAGGAFLAFAVTGTLFFSFFWTNPDRIRCETLGGDWVTLSSRTQCVQHVVPLPTGRP